MTIKGMPSRAEVLPDVQARLVAALRRIEDMLVLTENSAARPPHRVSSGADRQMATNGQQQNERTQEGLREEMRAFIEPLDNIKPRFGEIHGLHAAKDVFERLGSRMVADEDMAEWKTSNGLGVLLFGPQGTGKTVLVRAFAEEFGLTFFNVPSHSILQKYVGDAEK